MKQLVVISALGFGLAGCVNFPERNAAPVDEAPADWVSAPMDGGERLAAEELAVWWTLFEDEKLTSLVQRSLDANLDLRTAAARVAEALARVGVARGERVPQVTGTAGVAATRLSDASGGGVGDRDFLFSSLGLDASWEIDLWGRIRASVASADAAAQASVEDFRGVRALIAVRVVGGYATLREVQLRQHLAERNVEQQRETLKLTRGRFDAGLVPKLDVNQAELNLARTEAILPALRQREAETRRALEILAGLPPGGLAEMLEDEGEVPLPKTANLRDLPANVIRRRPDLRAAEQRFLAAASRVGVAEAELYPRLSLSGSFAWEARNGDSLLGGDAVGYRLGPALRIPIFQGGRLRAQADIAMAQADQAELAYRQQVLQALGEVENALTAFREEQRRMKKLQEGVTSAEATVGQVRSLYENGLVTFLNVLDAERNLAAVQDEAAASLGQTSRNLAGVYRAFGGGWDAPDFEEDSFPKRADAVRTRLSLQTAVAALIESDDSNWRLRIEAYETYSREDPRATGMVEELTLSKPGTDLQTHAVLEALLPGERVRITWEEAEIVGLDETTRVQGLLSAERVSVKAE